MRWDCVYFREHGENSENIQVTFREHGGERLGNVEGNMEGNS
jgi:hypothetical protein